MEDKKFYIISIDDFGFLLPGLDDILRLKQHYEGFKITCFTIPFPRQFFMKENANYFSISKYRKWAEIINSYSDWMEIAIHGFAHTHMEMDGMYYQAGILIDAVENLWKEVGLKYVKMFKAPYWQYSYDSLNFLRDDGYITAMDRNKKIFIPEGLKTYTYNWSVEEKQLPDGKYIKGHSHTLPRGVKNALGDCYENITKLIPPDAKWLFASEAYEAEEKCQEEKNLKK